MSLLTDIFEQWQGRSGTQIRSAEDLRLVVRASCREILQEVPPLVHDEIQLDLPAGADAVFVDVVFQEIQRYLAQVQRNINFGQIYGARPAQLSESLRGAVNRPGRYRNGQRVTSVDPGTHAQVGDLSRQIYDQMQAQRRSIVRDAIQEIEVTEDRNLIAAIEDSQQEMSHISEEVVRALGVPPETFQTGVDFGSGRDRAAFVASQPARVGRIPVREDELVRGREAIDVETVIPAELRTQTHTGRWSSQEPNVQDIQPERRPGYLTQETDYSVLERRVLASMSRRSISRNENGDILRSLPGFVMPPHQRHIEQPEDFKNLQEGEELEIVARTTTSRTPTRRRRAPARGVKPGPTDNAPIYTWAMQSSIPRNGGEYIQYEVRLNEDGTTSCNCPGWIFKKKTEARGCKHTRHVEEESKDFYQRHRRGEQLPTTAPTEEQLKRFQNSKAGKKAAETGEDGAAKFSRFVELD